MLDDTHFLFAFGDFELGDAGFFNEIDQFLEFTQIHEFSFLIRGVPPDG